MTGENAAPAEMPAIEEIKRVLFEFATCTDIAKGPAALDANAGPFARAIVALFAPIMAEKEREIAYWRGGFEDQRRQRSDAEAALAAAKEALDR